MGGGGEGLGVSRIVKAILKKCKLCINTLSKCVCVGGGVRACV